MKKGAINQPLMKVIRFTRSIALMSYSFKVINSTFLKQLVVPVVSVCNYVMLRKMGNTFVEMEISSICNSRCVFCPYVDITKTDKKLQVMSSQTFGKVLDKLRQVNYRVISFTPTTGDTLVNPEWDTFINKSLSLDQVDTILLYTNGILMNEKNIEKVIALVKNDTSGKIFSILFSLGGFDEKTYEFMFGVNKFKLVIENISRLLSRLHEEKLTLLVHLEFRIPRDYKLDLNVVKRAVNPAGYPFTGVRVLREFLGIEGLKRYPEISYKEDICVKQNACSYLRKTRFAADGGVWADGCVVSELPGDFTLQLGSVDDSWDTLETKRKAIIDGWNTNRIIPFPCEKCTMYRNDNVSLKNDPTIPIWKTLYV